MSEPAALKRARSLRNHVSQLGCDPGEFFVQVTPEEAWELVRWYRAELKRQAVGEAELNLPLLDRDIAKARKKNDPFAVLENFSLCGLAIKPTTVVH